jgi:CRP/FNR family cyclic AMP-dependent transcriptional regulator
MQRTTFLKNVDIFLDMRPKHIEKLAAICKEVTFQQGEVIVRENTPSDEMYAIVQGEVDIILDPKTVGGTGAPKVIATLRRGQTFGEVGLVDSGYRSASAVARTDNTQLLALRRDELLGLCEEDHEFGYILMRNIAADLAFKIRNTDLMVREKLLWESQRNTK